AAQPAAGPCKDSRFAQSPYITIKQIKVFGSHYRCSQPLKGCNTLAVRERFAEYKPKGGNSDDLNCTSRNGDYSTNRQFGEEKSSLIVKRRYPGKGWKDRKRARKWS